MKIINPHKSWKVSYRHFALALFSLCIFKAQIVLAADHIDAPLVREDARKDITDVFVFRSPSDSSRLVLAMNLFTPVGAPDNTQLFDPEASGEYALFIDTNGDQAEDHILRIVFDSQSGSAQGYTISGIPGSAPISGTVSTAGEEAKVSSSSSVNTFAGLRDDPFFFDFEGYNSFLSAPCIPTAGLRCPGNGNPVDFFLGLNVASIVIELPITSLSGISSSDSGKIGVWAESFSK